MIGSAFAKKYASEHHRAELRRLDAIIDASAQAYGTTREIVLARSRTLKPAAARQVAMYVAREFGYSYSVIAKHLRREHHTTVLHGCRKIDALISTDPGLRATIAWIREKALLA